MNESLPVVRTQSLPATTIDDLARAGSMLARSQMFGAMNEAAGFVVAATCHAQGISVMEFNRTYHIIDGRPSMRSDAMLAEFRKRGAKYKIVENSDKRAAMHVMFEGNGYDVEYSMTDAEKTGDCYKSDGKTLKHNWSHRPKDMLWARLASNTVRRLCPEIVAGLYTPEELLDIEPTRNTNQSPVVLPPDEAERRAAVAATVNDEPDKIDYTVCPIGGEGFRGVQWADMDNETLEGALKSENPGMTHTHKAAIRLVIEQRSE